MLKVTNSIIWITSFSTTDGKFKYALNMLLANGRVITTLLSEGEAEVLIELGVAYLNEVVK